MPPTAAHGFRVRLNPTPVAEAELERCLQEPGFGSVFTDHMFTARWTAEDGWGDAEISPFEALSLSPAAAVLQYGQQVFEGLKAYRADDGTPLFFRLAANAARMAASATRLSIPAPPQALFVEAVEALVAVDRRWVPERTKGSLYLRPFIIASEPLLSVRSAREFLFCVIASPTGDYFANGLRPLRLWVSDRYSRAAHGGTGAAKSAGNYAGSLLAQEEAAANGCDQALFLDAAESRWIEELGAMSLFFVDQAGTLVTPPLGGTILPGITRDSIITLARDEGLRVEECAYAFEDMMADAKSGRLAEVFACGTAAVVAPVGGFRRQNADIVIGQGGAGPVTLALRQRLLDLQFGIGPDPHRWVQRVGGELARRRA